MQLGGVKFVEFFTPFFDTIKSFIHLFYNRTVPSNGVSVDFSFFIATILMLLLVKLLSFIAEQMQDFEEKYDKMHKDLRKQSEKRFNIGLEKEYVNQAGKDNKALLFVTFSVTNISKDSFYNSQENVNAGLEEKTKLLPKDFCLELEKTASLEKKILSDGVLVYFDKFDEIENNLLIVEETLKSLKLNYKSENWQIKTFTAVDTYSKEEEVIPKLRGLVTLTKLGLQNKMLCLSTFKQRYSLLKEQKYKLESYGVYNINEREEVYFLEKIK